jgi:hypothetical protein
VTTTACWPVPWEAVPQFTLFANAHSPRPCVAPGQPDPHRPLGATVSADARLWASHALASFALEAGRGI